MTAVQEISCRLCLEILTDKSFEAIDDVIKSILDALSLKLKFHSQSKEVICNSCRRKLNAALEFKSICVNTDNTINSYVDREKILQLNLIEVYMKEKGSEQSTGISYDQKVCRVCMQLVRSEFKCIREEEFEVIQKFFPEMDVTIVKDPVVCKPCFDSLCAHNTFLTHCLEVEENIKDTLESWATESQTDMSPSDLFIKTEDLTEESEINEMEMLIKAEYVDIKWEEDEGRDPMLFHSKNEIFDAEDDGFEVLWKHKIKSMNECGIKTRQESTLSNNCDKCIYETDSMVRFTTDENTSEMCNCKTYQCGAENKSLDLLIYSCTYCDYKTKHKCSLLRHTLTHKDPSQVPMYKCDICDYKTKYKSNVTYHQMGHKDSSQVVMYKCKDCDYQTRHKANIKDHLLIHKDPSQVPWYKCDQCEYKTMYKRNIPIHQLIHKDPSEVKMYQCEDCDYKTKRKSSLVRHALRHKDSSQISMYKCNACDYESRYKNCLTYHQLSHKDSSLVQMYKCNDCDFKTKRKSNMKTHSLIHKDRSQVPRYKCDNCDYESIYKRNFNLHLLTHKDPSKVQMYRCDVCDFETKHKNSFKRHQLMHKKHMSADGNVSKSLIYEADRKESKCGTPEEHPMPTKLYKYSDQRPVGYMEIAAMTAVPETSCRLCLQIITDESFEVIDNVIKAILHALSLKLRFDNQSKWVICNSCRRMLDAALKFKSTCVNADNTINSYVDREKFFQLNLLEVYMKEKGREQTMGISYDQKVCRLCMQLVRSEFKCVREGVLEAIEKFFPEMDVAIVKDPVVCKQCFDSLCAHNTFLTHCLEVEENIIHTFESSATESQTDMSPSDLFIKTEDLTEESEINEMEMLIKAECVDIKSEEDEGRDPMLFHSKNGIFDAENDGFEILWKHKIRSMNECGRQESTLGNNCDKCIREAESMARFKTHENASEMCNCKTYQYETENKSLDLLIYSCTYCDYKTKQKCALVRHTLKHKDPSQVPMYKCDVCDYESKYKSSVSYHQLSHKDSSQVVMYKCNDCDYQTRHKTSIKGHLLIHKDRSEVPRYKCNQCEYESIYKRNITSHQLKHKDPSEVKMYQCNDCDYKTKHKSSLVRHALKHKDSSQISMYKCDACDYESRYKNCLIYHLLSHKDSSQVQTYKCNDCGFKTKHKSNIKNHLLTHKDRSQAPRYKCEDCDYESIYKRNYNFHLLTHKDPLRVRTFRCDECDFVTKHKHSLKGHQLKHKKRTSADVNVPDGEAITN
ncbi:zinc finger protein 91-like [Anoplophora glabripennis]|uniref:zinc finger protein 91-like n=1 Tax=Anoplophora glabripennis TaxID=217634 RepID=UPI000874D746|nr:zinc finger protein 91-like [Anoplophora glabripennis]